MRNISLLLKGCLLFFSVNLYTGEYENIDNIISHNLQGPITIGYLHGRFDESLDILGYADKLSSTKPKHATTDSLFFSYKWEKLKIAYETVESSGEVTRQSYPKSLQTDVNSDAFHISYKFNDILNDRIELGIYDFLILFQMDYIFSDSELKIILMKAKSAGISGLLVITPSLFNLNVTKNLNILFHEIGSLILYLYDRIKTSLFSKSENKNKNILNYRRTSSHFINIFKNAGFKIKQEKTYINPNGSFNFFHFSNKN